MILNMLPRNIPQDINIELLLSYFPKGSCKVSLTGLHKRNVYNDLLDIEENLDGTLLLNIGRHGLYNALPEFMFHPIDRFDNLPKLEEKERFAEESEAQEQEKDNAHKFFAPIDLMLLLLRMETREKLKVYTESDKIMIDILGDRITEEQKKNRFIRQIIPFLPSCKNIRGNKTLISFMLRKIFTEEGINIRVQDKIHEFYDPNPRYKAHLPANLDAFYVDNRFDEQVLTYTIQFWPEEECNENFLQFVDEVETLRLFIQDYFLSLEQLLHFEIVKDEDPLRLSDEIKLNYLNYNTNV
jgi:hypothetical protein